MARKPASKPAETAAVADSAFAEIRSLAATLHALHQKRAALLTPIAKQLIREKSRNVAEIEQTLDHLLDCACIPEGLAPFKALCRYYYGINPTATASYVHGYRDMWDGEGDKIQEVVPKNLPPVPEY